MNNKETILNCALRLFSTRGCDSVGVQEVVDAAGITKPTLYHYFGSKKGLIEAIFETVYTDWGPKLQAAADYRHDITLTLNRLALVFFDFAKENEAFYRLQLSLYFAPDDNENRKTAMPYQEKLYLMLEELFLKASQDHGNMKGRHKLYALSFQGMLNTYIGLYLNRSLSLDETLARQAVHQFMHGIFS